MLDEHLLDRPILVEERKEDSRQRWQRTKEEVEEQKRVLKSQLQQRVRVWSENLKKPNFIRTRDKISFSIGVANACFSPLIGRSIVSCARTLTDAYGYFSGSLASSSSEHLFYPSTATHYTSILHLQA